MTGKFLKWMSLKEKLDSLNHKAPFVKEGDLWWMSLGENIGSEINGKSNLFSRPGLVIKRLTGNFYLVAPMTSQKKEGSWYVPIGHENREMHACLHQVRTIDYRRLSSRLGQVTRGDFNKVKDSFLKLYK